MSLTPEQELRAAAYEHIFSDSAQTQLVLDDLTSFCGGLSETQQPGAMRLLLYILLRRSELRRAKRLKPKERTKT